jgi:hypothetical protein
MPCQFGVLGAHTQPQPTFRPPQRISNIPSAHTANHYHPRRGLDVATAITVPRVNGTGPTLNKIGGPLCLPLTSWAAQTMAASDLLGVEAPRPKDSSPHTLAYYRPHAIAIAIQTGYLTRFYWRSNTAHTIQLAWFQNLARYYQQSYVAHTIPIAVGLNLCPIPWTWTVDKLPGWMGRLVS